MISESLLPKLELLNFLPKDCYIEIAHGSSILHCKKGTMITDQAKCNNYMYFVRQGWVKVFRNTFDGHEILIDILAKNDLYGEELILGSHVEPCNIQAIASTDVIALPVLLFRKYADHNANLVKIILQHMLEKNQKLLLEKEHLSSQSSAQRIACFLLQTFGMGDSKENVKIKIPYDKSLLALKLGIRPETFSRALNRLCHDCDLHAERDAVYVKSTKQLQEYACSNCSITFPCHGIKH